MKFRNIWLLAFIVLLAGCGQKETIFRGESADWIATYTQVMTSDTEGVADLRSFIKGQESLILPLIVSSFF